MREVALCREKACAGLRTAPHEKWPICDPSSRSRSQPGSSRARVGSHATHGGAAGLGRRASTEGQWRRRSALRRLEQLSLVDGQAALRVGGVACSTCTSTRRRSWRRSIGRSRTAMRIRGDALSDGREVVSGRLREAASDRERRSLRTAMVRCGSSILGGVVPIGDPLGARRVLRAVRLRGEGAAGRARLARPNRGGGTRRSARMRRRSRARGHSAVGFSTRSRRISGGSGRLGVTRR